MDRESKAGKFEVSRRSFLLGSAAIGVAAAGLPVASIAADNLGMPKSIDNIRPFKVDVPAEALADLRRRLAATRWPDSATVSDRSQGVEQETMKDLVAYWQSVYDWRRAERKLNTFPQFLTTIDGLDIHFIHLRSPHETALPLIMTHGWPGSIFELLDVIDPLTDPTAYGGKAEDAFHLVIPSIPGFGFSQKPTSTGWDAQRIAMAWAALMKRLGYDRYVSQGGDWGAIISDTLARQAPAGLVGIHVNRIERSTTLPPDAAQALKNGGPAPDNMSADEKKVFDEARDFLNNGFGYASILSTRPETVGYGLADSPVGLAAWLYDKIADWVFTRGAPEQALSRDDILDNITLYWLTNTGPSSGRIYWENLKAGAKLSAAKVPVAVTVFPGEVYRPPRKWLSKAYPQLVYYHQVSKGGHFAAWEEPELFTEEIRAGFRPMRS
ncbi:MULTISPECIES: epoxide hydrolase family protein [unclassified Ensifer]|uniref:epoxide hydrolase family protein n=1 Tax=unclassified Ensifer TaxID=2633371 RepID=UPI000812CAB1|nr:MULTISPECIES: epoxide hydrolase family protein [unclassified Ensifer]OCP03034.1 multidrug MFS transporter [Ensifer sp. LC14]OCP08174.1 multidrug MFS transporter [Ensifer sp. LC11]OCP08847.1 multidrug MFS transporter [Ensifer sp. LC13]OCP32216.1 multidrug MFS transporter [Ensifer sp. LC499]